MRGLAAIVTVGAVLLAAPGLAWIARGGFGIGALVGVLAVGLALRDIRGEATSPAWAVALLGTSPVLAAVGRGVVGPLDFFGGLAAAGLLTGALGTWGLPRRAAIPLLGCLILALPVGDVADAILSWPLRRATAAAAATLLNAVSHADLSTGTALALEGGVAHVDVPCAGLRGLWSLTAILLLGALLSRARTDLRWWGAATAGTTLFLAANLVRVVAVVGLGHVLGWTLVADVVHQPLGILGFALAAGVALWIQRETPAPAEETVQRPRRAALVLGAWLAASLVPQASAAVEADPGIAAPAGLVLLAPSAPELTFAGEHGASVMRLGSADPPATVALVTARSWLAHHVPRQCLEAAGWTIAADVPQDIGGEVRFARLSRGDRRATAVWWLQSSEGSTGDMTVRILDGLRGGGRWVLVSVLADGDRPPSDAALAGLVRSLRAHVASQLTESP